MRNRILPLALIVLELAGLFWAVRLLAQRKAVQDLVQYWAAAKLIAQNPYSEKRVEQIETAAGNIEHLVVHNPPWTLLFFLPLRWMGFPSAYAFWTVLSLAVLAGCSRAMWHLYTARRSLLPTVLPLLFGPTISMILLGQCSVLVLLGVTLFLVAVERKRDWVAGASWLLILVKPQLSPLLMLTVGWWVIASKRYKVICGAVLAIAAGSLAITVVNPRIFAQYFEFMQRYAVPESRQLLFPNLSGLLYRISGHRLLALVPSLAGVAWLTVYARHHRTDWEWKTHGPLVVLVSVACSYYSFPYDEVVVLPALIAAATCGNRGVFLAGFILTNAGYALYLTNIAARAGFDYTFLWWTASAWLLTYIFSSVTVRRSLAAGAG